MAYDPNLLYGPLAPIMALAQTNPEAAAHILASMGFTPPSPQPPGTQLAMGGPLMAGAMPQQAAPFQQPPEHQIPPPSPPPDITDPGYHFQHPGFNPLTGGPNMPAPPGPPAPAGPSPGMSGTDYLRAAAGANVGLPGSTPGTNAAALTSPVRPTPQMRTPGDADASGAGPTSGDRVTGVPTTPPPSTLGTSGSDGVTAAPATPLSYTGSMKADRIGPDSGWSWRDKSTYAGEDATRGTTETDPTPDKGVVGAKSGERSGSYGDLAKILGAIAQPSEYPKMANAPLPQHESRFTPVDLLTMIQALSQAGGKTAPMSLGQLVGGR